MCINDLIIGEMAIMFIFDPCNFKENKVSNQLLKLLFMWNKNYLQGRIYELILSRKI